MKKIVLILLLTCIVYPFTKSYAQVVDKKAIAIVDQLAAKMKSYPTLKIDFTYTLENKQKKINQSKKGSIVIKSDKYSLNVAGQKIISDGKTTWTYIPDANEVQINSVNPNEDEGINLTKLLATYSKNFRPKLIKEERVSNVNTQVVDLVPLKTKAYYKVRLVIDKDKTQILSTEIYNKNESTFKYKVDKFQPNPKVVDSDFTFKKTDYPANVEVNDMR